MNRYSGFKIFVLVFFTGLLTFYLSGCSDNSKKKVAGYSIDPDVQTTAQRAVLPDTPLGIIEKQNLSQVSNYDTQGYGTWAFSLPGLTPETRAKSSSTLEGIMPEGYDSSAVTQKTKLLSFFAMTDVHITDKESPSQLIYLEQLYYSTAIGSLGNYPWATMTSVYSPVMLYSTQVLDAAVQTVNVLHKNNPFDFGIFLGDVINSTQYNELRWFIDVLDGKVITPSSGAHAGAGIIDYQKPFKAAGLDSTIPWYSTLGNHDHFWIGSVPVNDFLRQSYISDTIIATGDILLHAANYSTSLTIGLYYMGVIDGSTPYGDITGAGLAASISPPKVTADPDRRSLERKDWIREFSNTTSKPVGHGFGLVDSSAAEGFACYSFVPKSDIPIRIIVLDDTQREDDLDTSIHGHGFLDAARWSWLQSELKAGDDAMQLMIIAAHIPIGVSAKGTYLEWWDNSANASGTQNAVTLHQLIAELRSHPNFLMWTSGHRHFNTVKAFPSPDTNYPEQGFWQVETSSLRDFPQQFRTFEIYLNSDYTIAIKVINVDPSVKEGTPAWMSRKYAVAAQQITKFQDIYQINVPLIDDGTQTAITTGAPSINVSDPGIKRMDPAGSYNAILYKKLSAAMENHLKNDLGL